MAYLILELCSLLGSQASQNAEDKWLKSFYGITKIVFTLHHLLPPPHDSVLQSRLRVPAKYARICDSTQKYQSFMSYALSKYQTS